MKKKKEEASTASNALVLITNDGVIRLEGTYNFPLVRIPERTLTTGRIVPCEYSAFVRIRGDETRIATFDSEDKLNQLALDLAETVAHGDNLFNVTEYIKSKGWTEGRPLDPWDLPGQNPFDFGAKTYNDPVALAAIEASLMADETQPVGSEAGVGFQG